MRDFRSKAHLKEYLESHGEIGIKPHELIQQMQKENKGKKTKTGLGSKAHKKIKKSTKTKDTKK